MKLGRTALLVAALLTAACSGEPRSTSTAPPDADGAWMDGATVVVARDAAVSRETVKLVDPASGFEQVFSDEPLTPGVAEADEEPAVTEALAMALTR